MEYCLVPAHQSMHAAGHIRGDYSASAIVFSNPGLGTSFAPVPVQTRHVPVLENKTVRRGLLLYATEL